MKPTADSGPPSPPAAAQFGLSALFWLVAAVSAAMAFVRLFDPSSLWVGMFSILLGIAAGTAVGWPSRRLIDGLFWSVMGSVTAFLCSVGQDLYDASFHYGWLMVGAASGAVTGVLPPGKWLSRTLLGGLVGTTVLGSFALAIRGFAAEPWLEVLCASLASAMLGAVVELLFWFERRTQMPRHVLATGMIIAVVLGNIAARQFVPGW